MNDADVKRKLQDARRTDTAAGWRSLARELRKHKYYELAKECDENAIECELRDLEKKNG